MTTLTDATPITGWAVRVSQADRLRNPGCGFQQPCGDCPGCTLDGLAIGPAHCLTHRHEIHRDCENSRTFYCWTCNQD